MRGSMIIIHTDGTIEKHDLTAAPKLEDLQTVVGGWLEGVPFFERFMGKTCAAFCNEEGKLDELDFNPVATEHWHKCIASGDVLVGNVVVIVGDKQLMEAL